MLEESLHADAEIFKVPVGNRPAGGLASPALRAADADQNRRDDLVTQGEQGSDDAGGQIRGMVAAVLQEPDNLPADLKLAEIPMQVEPVQGIAGPALRARLGRH